MKISLTTLIFLIIFSFSVHAQSTPEPLYREVYSFLARMAQKGVIQFNDEIIPVPRKYILEKLLEVKEKVDKGYKGIRYKVTALELEELEFYLRDYNLEFALMAESKGRRAESSVFINQRSVVSIKSHPNPYIHSSNHPIIQPSNLSRRSSSEARTKANHPFIHASIHPKIHGSLHSYFPYTPIPYTFLPTTSQPQPQPYPQPYSSPSTFWFRDNLGRYRLFSYISKLFKLNVDPILGYTLGTQKGEKYSHLWNGARFYGYVSNWLGFSFDFRDNSEDGKDLDMRKAFTPETGVVVSRAKKNHFEYSRTNTSIMVDWSWGDVLIGKEPLVWGYGESGNIVHSTKAPSYPMIRLDLNLTKWLRFNYFHGWLASNVIDSNASYSTFRANQSRDILRSKFITSHSLILNALQGLSVSFGESVIYSDKEEFLFVFPLMFYRSADHYLSQPVGNNAGANSQFFLGISSRNNIPNTHLYGTLYIDELTLSTLFDHKKQRTQIAFQLGASVTDLPIPNLDFTLEYTKLYPFVYRHYIPTQTYENHGYLLGDWMGHNGDRIYGSIKYRILRGLQAELWGEYIRKGGDGVPNDQYITPQPPFLFGLRTNYTRYGAEVKYEITHDLFARVQYNRFLTSREQADGRFVDSKVNEFYFAIYYGI